MNRRKTPRHHPAAAARGLLLLVPACLLLQPHPAMAAQPLAAPVRAWLEAQPRIKSWSAKVQQTRHLKTLTEPLVSHGRVWFAAPTHFRWEMGDPPVTIAVRQADQLLVTYPRLSRAERYSLTDHSAGPWKETLALLDAGFPQSESELLAQFDILSQTATNHHVSLLLQPKSPSALKMLNQIEVVFDQKQLSLLSTKLAFADGSTWHNEFSDAQLNPVLEEALFQTAPPPGYKLTEPLNGR